jgi:hypothetical protein
MKEKLYAGYLNPLFSPFYKKRCNWNIVFYLRNPVKATSLGHLRDTEAKPQYKER